VVLVRLVVVQPGARVVQAAGDFNGWNPSRTPLEQTADGAWTVTLPLEPGRYEYQFVVDGERWIGDPFAVEQSNDGFGSRNAVLDVRPAEASL
jgi:1,4-alpha-glucan branching enzyme